MHWRVAVCCWSRCDVRQLKAGLAARCRDLSTGTHLATYKGNSCPRNGLCCVGEDHMVAAQTSKDSLHFWVWHKVGSVTSRVQPADCDAIDGRFVKRVLSVGLGLHGAPCANTFLGAAALRSTQSCACARKDSKPLWP